MTKHVRGLARAVVALALAAAAAPATTSVVLAAPVPTPGQVVDVQLDKAKILRMPAHAVTIVVGNPIIADVTALKADGLLVVTGKGFGETNLIFLDSTGTAVEEADIRVTASSSLMTVQRGMDRESYSCQPRCEPAVALGDADGFLKNASSQITQRNGLATPTSH